MSTTDEQANQLLQMIGVSGEEGLRVAELMAAARGSDVASMIGDVIPGFSSKHQRVLLISDQHIYLVGGTKKKPGTRLGVYPTAADTMQYERGVLKFPDGQSVKVSEFQAKALIAAAGGNEGKQLARRILEAAGTGESSWTGSVWGTNPVASKRGTVDRVTDRVLLGGGTETHEKLLLLITEKHVYVGRDPGPVDKTLGVLLGVYSRPVEELRSDGPIVAFPDGNAVQFQSGSEPAEWSKRLTPPLDGARSLK